MDMNAAGNGRAVLKLSGVANDDASEVCVFRNETVGLVAPMGSDLVNCGLTGLISLMRVWCATEGLSGISAKPEAEPELEDDVIACDRG